MTRPSVVTRGALRGTSFGDRWVEVDGDGKCRRALERLVASRGKTGPKSLQLDDIVLRLVGRGVSVIVEGVEVGTLTGQDVLAYLPVLRWAQYPIEVSGSVLIDADGHPGSFLKLYLPSPELLVPVNRLDPTVALFPAWDRAGGLTLANGKPAHQLVDAATESWWAGSPRAAWVVLTRDGLNLTATLDGMPLPEPSTDRSLHLIRAWGRWHPDLTQLQFESIVYQIKAGRQVNVRFRLA